MSVDEVDKSLMDRFDALFSDDARNTSNQQVKSTFIAQQLGIKQFDESTEPFENYVERLEACFRIHNIPLDQQANALIYCLKPNLYQLLKNSLLPRTYLEFSYEELKYKLNNILNPKPSVIKSRQTFLKRKQKAKESISDYVAKLRESIVDCRYPDDMVEEMLRDAFIAGLRSELIANKLVNNDEITIDMALAIALSLEEEGFGDAQKFHKSKKQYNRSKTQSDVLVDGSRRFKFTTKTPPINSSGDSARNNEFIRGNTSQNFTATPKKSSSDLPFSGKQTDTFSVSLPASNIQNVCKVTLEWFGNQGSTERAILNVSSSNEMNISLNLDLNLADVVCVLNRIDSVCYPTTKNIEEKISPLTIHYNPTGDNAAKLRCISTIWQRVHNVPKAPRERSIWGTTELGDVYVSDLESLKKIQITMNNRYLKEYQIKSPTPFRMSLPNKFPNGMEITINGYVPQNPDRFHVNLICGHNNDIALHFNPRFKDRVIVRNSLIRNEWGPEERTGVFLMKEKLDFTLTILCMEEKFKIFLNGIAYTFYNHRVQPELITDIEIDGEVDVHGILYESDNVILDPKDLIWRKLEKNLRQVETCPAGVTWGIGHNGEPICYKKTANGEERWYQNVCIGDNTKLKDLSLSLLDDSNIALWAVNDKGMVLFRERVTIQNAAGTTWTKIETDQLVRSICCGGWKQVWCCGEKGTCFWRFGITDRNPTGEAWRFVKSQNVGSTFKKIAVGKWSVWVLDDKGDLYVRRDITPINPGGVYWSRVSNNDNNKFKHIYVNDENLWAITKKGVLCKRMGIHANNPEGLSWNYGLSANWYHISE